MGVQEYGGFRDVYSHFLVIHLRGFWYEMHWGNIGVDENGHKDLYNVVVLAFQSLWYVGIYVASMVFLAYHLLHGFYAAFQTLGWNDLRYRGILRVLGAIYAIAVPLLFALIPVVMYVQHLRGGSAG